MSDAAVKKDDAKVFVSFWGNKKIDPYELLISKASSKSHEIDRSITISRNSDSGKFVTPKTKK